MTYSMETTVEASSLSAITAIAANPPSHPNTPTGTSNLPLKLYIARVPGSRDVFLTPMKPREKVVSAEDVQSSLYYVHINCDDDQTILDSLQSLSSVNTEASQLPTITEAGVRRKPVLPLRPAASKPLPYSVSDPMPDVHVRPPSPRKPEQISRKAVLGDISNAQTTRSPNQHLPELPHRPLPPPPGESHARNSLHAENVRLPRPSGQSKNNNPYFRQAAQNEDAWSKRSTSDIPPQSGTLTLIRRDPASNAQWNVASIHDPPVHEVSSVALLNPSAARRTKKGGAPLYLDITNPVYSQFIDNDWPDSRISTSTNSSEDEPPPPEGIFRRRLYMPGSKHADHGYGHPRLTSVDSASSGEMRRTLRHRPLSDFASNGGAKVDKRSTSYCLMSPWSGQCEFYTGATGKSLKCRHTLTHQGEGAVEVSELRFNLPTSARKSPTPALSASDKRSSYFSHMRDHSHDSWDGGSTPSVIIDDDGRLDLSLGQERAGGGFGGKQAKLGKLIIEPEGLKMLDLLVAANVGLWWRAYERV